MALELSIRVKKLVAKLAKSFAFTRVTPKVLATFATNLAPGGSRIREVVSDAVLSVDAVVIGVSNFRSTRFFSFILLYRRLESH